MLDTKPEESTPPSATKKSVEMHEANGSIH